MLKFINSRRLILIADVTCFIIFLIFSVPGQFGLWSYFQLIFFILWALVLLIHIFKFNLKPIINYFDRLARMSGIGPRQVIIFALAVCFTAAVVVILAIMISNNKMPANVLIWLPIVIAAIILIHVWLNRKPFFYYLGRKTGLAYMLCGFLLLFLGIITRILLV